MEKIEILAVMENLNQVFAFIHKGIEDQTMSEKARLRLDVAVEEIFTNIVNHAYDPETGPARIRMELLDDPLRVQIIFSDKGKPYNPLNNEEVDVQKKMENREVGGLGIYLLKKYTDGIRYSYEDGQNVVTIEKLLQ